MLPLLFGFFALITWNPISAIILWSGVLLLLAVIAIKRFVRRRAIMQHKEEPPIRNRTEPRVHALSTKDRAAIRAKPSA